MPRPSLKDQRSEEILDAYLTCVARFGLEGATQERIAAEAGVKRPLLRHYLGNREEMIVALTGHVVAGFAEITDAMRHHLGPDGSNAQLIAALFDEEQSQDPRLFLAYQALVTAVGSYPDMRAPLLASYEEFIALLETVLTRNSRGASRETGRRVRRGRRRCG